MTRLIPFLVLSASLVAQTPTRDTPARPASGTAHISGVVVTDDSTAAPVRMAMVEIHSAALTQPEMLTTDEAGRFDFANLPAGRFSLTVQKAGYVATDYGAANSRSSGVPIVVAAGETSTVTVKMPRGGVVTGTLTGPDGEPVQGVRVWLMRNRPDQSGGLSMSIDGPGGWRGQPRTDDRGQYRFYGLQAGEYFVAAAPNALGGQQVTAAEIEWANRLLRGPASASPPVPPPAGPSASYASIFFPGTADASGATPVIVAKGQERTNIDFTLQYQPTATLSGTMVDPNGLPPVSVQANLVMPSAPIFLRSNVSLRSDGQGAFTARGILPGAYVLAIRGTANPNGDPASAVRPGSLLWAVTDLNVDGRDQNDLIIRLQPGMTVTGRMAFDTTTGRAPDDLSRARVSLSAANTARAVSISAPDATVNPDGSFTVSGMVPGQYRFSATPPASGAAVAGWVLRSAIVAGRDVLDYPMDVRPGEDVSGAVVTLSDHPTELTGSFVDASGKPAPQYTLVVFSSDRALWMPGTRRIRTARPGNNGSFRVVGLAPGEYYLAAVGDLDQTVLYTPAFLEPLISSAMKITLGESEKRVQDIRIAGRTP